MLTAAFAEPVGDAQRCFRAVLQAMSRPGTVLPAGQGLRPPAPLDPATSAVLLTLIDGDTPLWLDAACTTAQPWLAFHCGAPIAATLATAAFCAALSLPDLAALPAGTDDDPERSATVILQLPALGAGTPWRLHGPGLAAPVTLHATGLPPDFAAIWAESHALYPRGIDLILCAGEALAALPRSVTVTEG